MDTADSAPGIDPYQPGSEDQQPRSVWLRDAPATDHPGLDGDRRADVAVLGGGITGLTTALLLRRSGASVILLEARRVGCGVTGASTAKVTSLHQLCYGRIERDFGAEAARTYAEANQAALEQMASLAGEMAAAGRSSLFERQPAYTYATDREHLDVVHQEAEAAQRAGLSATFTERVDLPFSATGAVRVDDQAQVDPYAYCLGLTEACVREGVEIFETTRVHDVVENDPGCVCEIVGGGPVVRADHVVVATLLPFLDRSGFFARAYPSRSYGIAVTLEGRAPDGMYISAAPPTRSLRPLGDGRRMIVVGEEHKVGHDADTRRRYQALESWTREHFPVQSVDHRWSAQDYMSVDGIPFVGRMPRAARVMTATGFGKWGLTTGTAAAMMLTELIGGKPHPWLGLFDATRIDVMPSARKLIEENADVAKRFVGDRLRSLSAPELTDLGPGEGGIVRLEGKRVAAYRDESGTVHACSPLCTHMKCYLQWNRAERSWDCPCHGSRFDYRGEVLQGPAVHPLERRRTT